MKDVFKNITFQKKRADKSSGLEILGATNLMKLPFDGTWETDEWNYSEEHQGKQTSSAEDAFVVISHTSLRESTCSEPRMTHLR